MERTLDGLATAGGRRPGLRAVLGALAAYLGTLGVLLGVVGVTLGTEWGYGLTVAGRSLGFGTAFLWALVGGFLLASPWLSWRRRGAGAVAVLGVALFLAGVNGAVCMGGGFGGPTVWGFSYDVATNALRFGTHRVGGDAYSCGLRPDRALLLVGSVLSAAGVFAGVRASESTD